MKLFISFLFFCALMSCQENKVTNIDTALQEYFAPKDSGVQMGGVKMIPIQTPVGNFKVWTKRFGSNPTMASAFVSWTGSCATVDAMART